MDSQLKNDQKTDLITLGRLYKNESAGGATYLSGNIGAFANVLIFFDKEPKGDACGWLKLAPRPPKQEGEGVEKGETAKADGLPF